jgi:hypothetical protein
MPSGLVTSRCSPADEGEEHLVDDGGDGVLVTGPEQELVAEQVNGKGGDTRGDVVFYLAALGRSLEDGRHDLVSGLEGLGVEVGDQGGIGEVVGGQAVEGIGADLGEPGRDPT